MKKCPNGHYYADELDHCPYCPEDEPEDNIDETILLPGDKTIILEDDGNNDEIIAPDMASGDAEKTIIAVPGEKGEEETVAKRKLVGWVVSYTLDETGSDFRLFEGKNVIGTDSDCEILVPDDETVSGKHATLFFTDGVFTIKNESSGHETFVNDKKIVTDTTDLNDGDLIKTGNTVFRFRTALQNKI